MALVRVDHYWGSTSISGCLPSIELVHSAIYVPFDPGAFFDADPDWGIYHEDGSLIDRAAYKRGNPPELVGQSLRSERAADAAAWAQLADAPPGDYLYVGPLIPHYGHFLLSSLSRLWPLITGDRGNSKLLFHAYGDPVGWFETPYVRDTLGALGLSPQDFVVFDHAVRIKNLRIPEASFQEMCSAHQIYAELCHTIGRALVPNPGHSSGGKPVFLSKTKLPVGVGRMSNEAVFLEALQAKIDVEIMHPQELTLAQQVALFASERIIIGTTSSAFHTSIFVEAKPKLVGISLRQFVPSNFKLIDELNGNDACYVFSPGGFRREERVGGFLESFHALQPDKLATEIADLLSANQGAIPLSEYSASLPMGDHKGTNYRAVMEFLHRQLVPKTYFEIGTLDGGTLALAECRSIAVDPRFQVASSKVIGNKEACLFFQMKSDDFFASYDPAAIFGLPLDMVFLDGMHRCEYLLRDFMNIEQHCKPNSVVILHDCLPLEAPMAERDQGHPSILPHRNGWWTGDVWRTVVALKKYREDLSISAFDAGPTGLIIITNLSPSSTHLKENYLAIVTDMLSTSLDEMGIGGFFNLVQVESTDAIMSDEKLTARYWL